MSESHVVAVEFIVNVQWQKSSQYKWGAWWSRGRVCVAMGLEVPGSVPAGYGGAIREMLGVTEV